MTKKDAFRKSLGWGRGMFIAGAAAGQSRGMPKEPAPWPIICCCGETIADQTALRAHSCEFLPTPDLN